MIYLDKIECKGKVVRGRVIENEIWIVANDVTDLFGYAHGRDIVSARVSKQNVLKYPLNGVKGNQCNMINIPGLNQLLNAKIKKVNEDEQKEILEVVEYAIEYLKQKRDYLELESYFIWHKKEEEKKREIDLIKSKKKSFWKRLLGL